MNFRIIGRQIITDTLHFTGIDNIADIFTNNLFIFLILIFIRLKNDVLRKSFYYICLIKFFQKIVNKNNEVQNLLYRLVLSSDIIPPKFKPNPKS